MSQKKNSVIVSSLGLILCLPHRTLRMQASKTGQKKFIVASVAQIVCFDSESNLQSLKLFQNFLVPKF